MSVSPYLCRIIRRANFQFGSDSTVFVAEPNATSSYRRRGRALLRIVNPITETAHALGDTPEGKVWRAAFTRLFVVGSLALLVLFLHSLMLWAWTRIKWTRYKPLPEILAFPRLEIIFFNVTLVSTTQVRLHCLLTCVARRI